MLAMTPTHLTDPRPPVQGTLGLDLVREARVASTAFVQDGLPCGEPGVPAAGGSADHGAKEVVPSNRFFTHGVPPKIDS